MLSCVCNIFEYEFVCVCCVSCVMCVEYEFVVWGMDGYGCGCICEFEFVRFEV